MQVQMSTTLRLAVMTLTVFGAACGTADSGPSAFVSMLGTDTVTVELFSRSNSRIEGQLVTRLPYTHRITYSADLNRDGTISRLEAETSTPAENTQGPASHSWTASITDGMATVERVGGQNPGSNSFEVSPGAIPTLGRASIAMFAFEQAMRQANASGDGEHPIELVYPTRPQPVPNGIKRFAGDTVAIIYFGAALLAWGDGNGNIQGADGTATTMDAVTERVAALDVDGLASAWAGMDARGEGIGVPSPGATTVGTIHGATLEVAYSQPAKRGRDIWGTLVPHDGVWRTGANAATILTTGSDLVVGGAELPAGSYTLWSTYSEDSQQLIINSETGQWGTAYNAANNFATIEMAKSELSGMLERFTISLEETAEGGMLHLDWDDARFSVDIQVP
jgi:hypothetical protein